MPSKKSKQVKRKTPAAPAGPVIIPSNSNKVSVYAEDGVETLFEAMSIVAVRCDEEHERFWVAQLLDDTIHEMLDDESAQVNVLYFEKTQDSNVYREGSYDLMPVQAILCEVHLDEVTPGEYKVPKRHLDRIENILVKEAAGEEVPEDALQPLKKRKASSGVSTPTKKGAKGAKPTKFAAVKLDKTSGLPKCIAKITTPVDDDDFSGKHAFRAKVNDVFASSKEVIRAVLTKNYKMLENLTTKPAFTKQIHSCFATRSVGVPRTALDYAIERNDLKAVNAFLALKDAKEKPTFAKKPPCALKTLDTGSHTSAFSDYNRRALNASRGGKEGNNALLKDQSVLEAEPFQYNYNQLKPDFERNLWSSPTLSYEMLMLFYPGDGWVHHSGRLLPSVARSGNHVLAHKLVSILLARGGWGYNNLHAQVLGTEPLEPFKKVSVLKKATNHNVRPLHFAAINPNPAYLQALVDEIGSSGLGEVDFNGWQAVHYAAACTSPEPLKILLEGGSDVMARTKDKDLPIAIACRLGRVENVKLLIEHGGSQVLEAPSSGGFRPIHHASQHGHSQVVDALLQAGVNGNAGTSNKDMALGLAAQCGHLEAVCALLKHGVIVDILNKVRRTPLMIACMNGHVQIAVDLLNAGANANAVDSSLNSVMHYAAAYGWLSCVKLLHSISAATWFRNAWGYTPMAVAALKGRYDCSRFLIKNAPADEKAVDFRDANGATMLYLQCEVAENVEEIEFLLTHGADPNIGTLENNFPLQKVVNRNHSEELNVTLKKIAELLIKHGAHVTHEDYAHRGQPLSLAMSQRNQDLFDLLLPKSDLNVVDASGTDLWMQAVMNGSGDYLEKMLATAQPFHIIQSKDGQNAFHYIGKGQPSPKAVKKLLGRLPKAEIKAALEMIDVNGDVPLMELVQTNRGTQSNMDYLAEDTRFCELVKLLAEHTPNLDKIICQGSIDPEDPLKQRRLTTTETLLHTAASRTLNASNGWRGDDVLAILVEGAKWSEETINAVYLYKSALLLACENGHKLGVHALLTCKADPNFFLADAEKKVEGITPLFAAATKGYVEIVKDLLQHGAQASFAIKLKSPLHLALESNNTDMTAALMEHGADPCAKNADGLSALSSAILQGFSVTKDELHANEVKFGLAYNEFARDKWDDLCLEVPKKKEVAAESKEQKPMPIIDDADDSDYDEEGDQDDDNDSDGEENESMQDDEENVEEDNHEKSMEVVDELPTTAKVSAISVLLQHRSVAPAVGLRDAKGRTPLHYASANRDLHLLRAMLLLTADAVNAADNHQRTPLHFAINSAVMTPEATFEVESLLIAHGADVNAVDRFGFSALHFAFQKIDLDWHFQHQNTKKLDKFPDYLANLPSSESDPIETVGSLCLVAGIRVSTQDCLGRTCLHLGAATGAIVSTLSILHIAPDGALEVQDQNGDTALGRAMAHGRKDIVTNLIQQGANIHVQFTKGTTKTSLYYHAVQQAWQGVCHMLLNAGYCRRQAVEDSIRNHSFQLTLNLITSLVNSKDKILLQTNGQGETLLHILAQQDVDITGLVRTIAWQLVDTKVPVAAKTKAGETVLHFAAVHGHLNWLRFLLHLDNSLLDQLTAVKESPVLYAVKRNATSKTPDLTKMARILVYFARSKADLVKADIDGNNLANVLVDACWDSPAFDATLLLDLLDKVLAAKVSPNGLFKTKLEVKCSPQESSPVAKLSLLMRAIYVPHVFLREHTLALLLHYGANITETDDQGNTCFMHAVVRNQIDDVRICLGLISTAKRTKIDGTTKSLTIKIQSKQRQKAITAANKYGETVLHLAVAPTLLGSFENEAMVELLLKEKVPPKALDKAKRSAIDLARQQPSGVLLRVLTNEGKANSPPVPKFPTPPPFEHDATVFLNQCHAQGWVKTVAVPAQLHNDCQAGRQDKVFVDADGVEYSVGLTKVDVQSGQHGVNVFYRMQIAHHMTQNVFILFTNWGRIGESGKYQNTPFNDSASAVDEFKKIFKSKTGNVFGNPDTFEKKPGKYMLFKRKNERHEYDAKVTAPLTDKEIIPKTKSTLLPVVQDILRVVTDINCLEEAARSEFHNLEDLPLIELDPAVLKTAIDRLREIKQMILDNEALQKKMNGGAVEGKSLEASEIAALADAWRSASEAIAEKSSRYYELVPESDASSDSALKAFMTVDAVDKEITRVRQLIEIANNSKIILGAKASTTVHPLDYCYNALQLQLTPSSQIEVDMISKYFAAGFHDKNTPYKVSRVLSVQRKDELDRQFDKGHHMLLWHGTRKTNLMGILSRGLRIAPPEAPKTGYAFGKGIYFADESDKSLNYCGAPYILDDKRQVHYMLLCDVNLGEMHTVTTPTYMEKAEEGTGSTFAMGEWQHDPLETIVTQASRAKVPLGKLKRAGTEMPWPCVWAVCNDDKATELSYGTSFREAQKRLDDLLASGNKQAELTDASQKQAMHIFGYRWNTPDKVSIAVQDKELCVSGQTYSITFHVKIDMPDQHSSYAYLARKYFNVFETTGLPEGYKLIVDPPVLQNNEYIVYDEAQARICYLVEIEINHKK